MARARNKQDLKRELLGQLESLLASARAAHSAATEGAVHTEARAENDKDTRGLEQSYLARGHAQRCAELDTAVSVVAVMPTPPMKKIAVGALVVIEEDDRERTLFMAAHGGGLVIGGDVTVVTPTSPMGRALHGKVADDECEVS